MHQLELGPLAQQLGSLESNAKSFQLQSARRGGVHSAKLLPALAASRSGTEYTCLAAASLVVTSCAQCSSNAATSATQQHVQRSPPSVVSVPALTAAAPPFRPSPSLFVSPHTDW